MSTRPPVRKITPRKLSGGLAITLENGLPATVYLFNSRKLKFLRATIFERNVWPDTQSGRRNFLVVEVSISNEKVYLMFHSSTDMNAYFIVHGLQHNLKETLDRSYYIIYNNTLTYMFSVTMRCLLTAIKQKVSPKIATLL